MPSLLLKIPEMTNVIPYYLLQMPWRNNIRYTRPDAVCWRLGRGIAQPWRFC